MPHVPPEVGEVQRKPLPQALPLQVPLPLKPQDVVEELVPWMLQLQQAQEFEESFAQVQAQPHFKEHVNLSKCEFLQAQQDQASLNKGKQVNHILVHQASKVPRLEQMEEALAKPP